MALKVEVGTLTAPAGTGNQTYNLVDTAFGTVKALLLWCAYNTAEGDVGDDGIFSQGFGTFRGGTPQQFSLSQLDDDGIGTSDCARGASPSLILRGYSAATPTVDYTAALVSLGDAQFVLNWADAPASQIKVHYMALGGDDITDALVSLGEITTAAGEQDVTVASGFGKPDLLLALLAVADGNYSSNGNTNLGIGVGIDDTREQSSSFNVRDAQPSMDVASRQRSVFAQALSNASGGQINFEVELTAKSAWPTDGFRVNKLTAPTGASSWLQYLALRGTFTAVVGTGTVPIAGTPPVTQDLPLGATPRGALFFHNSVPANAGTDTTHADLGTFGIGAIDGTREAWAGVGQDDGNTNSIAHRHHSESKAVKMFTPSASGTLTSEADGLFSGNNVRLSWNDIEASIAREYCYLLLGDSVAGPPRYGFVNFQDPGVL